MVALSCRSQPGRCEEWLQGGLTGGWVGWASAHAPLRSSRPRPMRLRRLTGCAVVAPGVVASGDEIAELDAPAAAAGEIMMSLYPYDLGSCVRTRV
jgi:hypothetical protein